MPVFNFSELSGTHEELMFSPVHADALGNLSISSRNFIAKEDTEEDTVAGGPVLRNMIIMWMMQQSLMKDNIKGTDKEKKLVKNILDQMVNEFKDIDDDDDEMDGIALITLRITRLTKGTAYCLIIFHLGSTLLIETLDKKRVRHSWEDPMEKTDLLMLKKIKENEDVELLGLKKLESILGRDLPYNDHPNLFNNTYIFLIPQDPDVFSHYGDKNHSDYCWLCGVTLRKLKKTTCAGCLVARYCTLGCQEEDWYRHRDYCMKTKADREEKNVSKNTEKVYSDWEQEVE